MITLCIHTKMVVIFCENCKNLMTLSYDTNNLQCKSCFGNVPLNNKDAVNLFTVYRESKIVNDYNITPNMKYDRTLPRTLAYRCKNQECPSQQSPKNPQIISFSRNSNLVQGYMCTLCDACWF